MSNVDLYGIPNALGDGGAYLAGDGAGGGGGASQTFLRALLQKISARLSTYVANETALAAVTSNNRTDGMLVFVKASTVGPSIWYRDDLSSAGAAAGSVVQSGDSTTGRWLILATQAELTGGASAPQKATATIAFGALAAGNSNGASVSVNVNAPLPANARILGVALRLVTPFTGGGATSVSLDLGTTGDPIAIVVGADVLHAAVDGMAFTMPLGKAPFKLFASAGAQLLARFTPDGSHQLVNLTAGSITIDVLYSVLA
jgi:hypothetical protein